MSCGLCNSLLFGNYYLFENTCNHSICIPCYETSINHINCNHFICPICMVPEIFNDTLSNPNCIMERLMEIFEDGESLFTYPIDILSLPLSIEEKYLIYQAPGLKNYFTILIDLIDEAIKTDLTYVFINKDNIFLGKILIGKIHQKISLRQYDLFNPMIIDRTTGDISNCFGDTSLLQRINLDDLNRYHIYKCVYHGYHE